jgi:cytochrome c5
MRALSLSHVLIGLIVLTVLLAVSHRAGMWGARPVAEAPPPTPAAIAFRQAEAERATRAAAAAAEQARIAAATQPAEEETVLAEGEGRAETFGYCTACHSTALIRRSRFSRDRWDELMDWMTNVHRMNPLEGELRTTIVNYLGRHYGEPQGQRTFTNPFLNN